MNLHGYKRKLKGMTRLIKSLKAQKTDPGPIYEIERAKDGCAEKVRQLKAEQRKKRQKE